MAKRAPAAKRSSKKRAAASPRNRKRPAPKSRVVARRGGVTISEIEELDALRKEIERAAGKASPLRWNADPDDVQRSVVQLVLTLVEFVRKLLERQAIRRMGAGTLTSQQTEDVGRALMQLEDTVRDLAARFGISPDELNLDLGPVGKLM
jgi:Gas vesicle protein K